MERLLNAKAVDTYLKNHKRYAHSLWSKRQILRHMSYTVNGSVYYVGCSDLKIYRYEHSCVLKFVVTSNENTFLYAKIKDLFNCLCNFPPQVVQNDTTYVYLIPATYVKFLKL